MQITSIEAIPVELPRVKPMIAAGLAGPLASSRFGLVRVRTTDGVEGIGEISMNGGFDGARMCPLVNDVLAPALLGSSVSDVRSTRTRMDLLVRDVEPAKAGVEMALWDAFARTLDLPLHAVLGGQVRDGLPVRWALGFGDAQDGADEAARQVARGFRAIKLKIGRPGSDADETMVRAVREAVGDDTPLVVDANTAFATPGQALHEIRRLEVHGLQLVEQPLPRGRLADHARLRARLDTPLLLDESMGHWQDAFAISEAGAADVASVYVCEAGGIMAALDAFTILAAGGLQGLLGSQCEMGVGTAAMAHVGVVAPALAYESDATGHLRYVEDVIAEQLEYRDGMLIPPPGPGLGVTLDPARLARFRIDA